MEPKKIQLTDIDGNDLLSSGYMHSFLGMKVDEIMRGIEEKREAAFTKRLSEMEIDFDFETERHRRFKRFAREITGGEEAIYYNDGSVGGLRIITFKTVCMSPNNDGETFSIECAINYY